MYSPPYPPVALRKPTVYHCHRRSRTVWWHGAFCSIKRAHAHAQALFFNRMQNIYIYMATLHGGGELGTIPASIASAVHRYMCTNTAHYMHTLNSSDDQY